MSTRYLHDGVTAAAPAGHMLRFARKSLVPNAAAIWRGTVGAAAVALAYQCVHWSGIVDARVLPSVIDILLRMVALTHNADYLYAIGETLVPALAGLTVAAVLAIPAGLLLGVSRLANQVTRGTIDLLRSLPGTALIPIFIVTIGQGFLMKSMLVVYVTVWPILFNTIYGVASVDRVAIESARSCRVEGLALWHRVMLPSAAPFIATGLRYALPISIVIVIASEIVVGSPEGIGGYLLLQQSHTFYRPDVIYAVLLSAGVIGFVLNIVMDAACDWLVGWDVRRGQQA